MLRYGIPTDSKALTRAKMCKSAECCECLGNNHHAKKKNTHLVQAIKGLGLRFAESKEESHLLEQAVEQP